MTLMNRKKYISIAVGLIALPFILLLLVCFLIYFPPVQRFAVKKATAYASQTFGMNVSIGRISLSFPIDVVLQDVRVVTHEQDTLLDSRQLELNLQMWPLLKKRLEIDRVSLYDTYLNSKDLISGVQVVGRAKTLSLSSHPVDIPKEYVLADDLSLDEARFVICLNDTTAEDTTSTETPWLIQLKKGTINRSFVRLLMPQDSLSLQAYLSSLKVNDLDVDLRHSLYRALSAKLESSTLRYDREAHVASLDTLGRNRLLLDSLWMQAQADTVVRMDGVDLSHLAFKNMSFQIDSLSYQEKKWHAIVRQMALKERSGLEIKSLEGHLHTDTVTLHIPQMKLETGSSYAEMQAHIDWDVLDNKDANLSVRLMADVRKPDILLYLPKERRNAFQNYPKEPFRLRVGANGTLNHLRLTALRADLPTAFDLKAEGTLHYLTDSVRRMGDISFQSNMHDMSFLSRITDGYMLPPNSSMGGEVALNGPQIGVNAFFNAHREMEPAIQDSVQVDSLTIRDIPIVHTAQLNALYDMASQRYSAEAKLHHLSVHEFMLMDSLCTVSGAVNLHGEGLDFFSRRTYMELDGKIDHARYGHYALSDADVKASLREHQLSGVLTVNDSLLMTTAQLDGHLMRNDVEASLKLNIDRMDWAGLHLSADPIVTSQTVKVNLKTDMKKNYSLDLAVTDATLRSLKKTLFPKDLYGGIASSSEYTQGYLRAGDLDLSLLAQGHVDDLTRAYDLLSKEITRQWEQRELRHDVWKDFLPTMYVKMTSGRENPIQNYLAIKGIGYKDLSLQMNTSSLDGLSAKGYLRGLTFDSLRMDSAFFNLNQDSTGIHLKSGIKANKQKRQEAFVASIVGRLSGNNGNVEVQYLNDKNEVGAYLGARAELQQEGINIQLYPDKPILVYRPFELNADNYIFIKESGRIDAEVSLFDKDNTGLQFYSNHADSLAQQDMTLELSHINLNEFRRIIPYMPNMAGAVDLDLHYIVEDHTPLWSASLKMNDFVYEGTKMGNWEANGVYLPGLSNDHFINGFLSKDGDEIAHINGSYLTADNDKSSITADLDLSKFPLFVANPFIPDNLIEFEGGLVGTLSLKGNPSNPRIDGELSMDSVAMFFPDYSARFFMDNRPVTIENSQMTLKDFNVYTKGKSPLTVNGTVDMRKIDETKLNLRMKATNYELINAPQTKRATAFGKIYVDFTAFLRGMIGELSVRGNMNVLGNSDFTYVMKDSPLMVNDRLGDMVTFVNFNDTTSVETEDFRNTTMTGVDLLLQMHIDQAVQARINIAEDGSNYMLMEGGGDLSFKYDQHGDMTLTGRYSFVSGEMKYQIPVIPLKTFNIQNGSYLEWTGPVMNPKMNIQALERVRARVGTDGHAERMVSFDVGVKLTETLEQLGLAFVLSAPEDASIQNELSAMSDEQQSRLAVTMLVTGTYMSESNTASGAYNVNNALNTFLQSQISDIVGKSMDFDLGVETLDDDRGRHTDYNFQFARRFWNNRVRVVVGGTVSTGNSAAQTESFIDKVSIEYRLDNSGTRYIRLFHDRNYESVLEGEVVETGVGYVLHRKLDKLSDLFLFKKKKDEEN